MNEIIRTTDFLNSGRANKIGLFNPVAINKDGTFLSKIRDSFTLTISKYLDTAGVTIDEFSTRNKKMLSDVENLSESEKESALMSSYKDMQTHLYLFAKNELNAARDFKNLLDQKDYYSSVLSGADPNTDYRDEAQYLYETFGNDEFTDKDYLQMRLEDTQKRINGYLDHSHKMGEQMKAVGFIGIYASGFIAAGGDAEKVTALLDNPDTLNALKDNLKSRTEENYIQKSEEAVEIYESYSKGLADIMESYYIEKSEQNAKSHNNPKSFLFLIEQIRDKYNLL
ncbi:MAG: hypothetical protein LBM59_06095 [Ruminococcus sp.]|nr:hypothetical protein [Ruminococcus sp.]